MLNPGSRDQAVSYATGIGAPGEHAHPPVNYHAYAACTGGGFHTAIEALPENRGPVLLLLRGNLRDSLKAIRSLKDSGRIVGVTFKEAGLIQVCRLVAKSSVFHALAEIFRLADFAISPTPDLAPLYDNLFELGGGGVSAHIPTPYPLEFKEWRPLQPISGRKGILVGTREFDKPERQHLPAILQAVRTARSVASRVTVMQMSSFGEKRMLRSLADEYPEIDLVRGPLPYMDWLKLIARHRVVFQLDQSSVPGQVAGDALLAGVPCLGGNGTAERLLFPDDNGPSATLESLAERLELWLTDDSAYSGAVDELERRGQEQLGWKKIGDRLQKFLQQWP